MKKVIVGISLLFVALTFNAQRIAFPGAEGYGKYAVGGRAGKVYEVTNLNDSGAGSLREAVEASGSRTVVFRVSGTISLKRNLTIKNPNITIAGQTAPGDGICIKKYPLGISANDVIIRYIRVRFGDESGADADAISSRGTRNVILDHVSASWSVDETMSIYHCENITVQWCMISESMFQSNHTKGAHGFGGIWGGNYSSYHHNLIAHHSSRNVRFASGCGNTDYRNNVVYNWGYNSTYGGEQHQGTDPRFAFSNINMVANYYKPGPATSPGSVSYRIANPSYRDVKSDYGKWYIDDNVMVDKTLITVNNWNGGVQPSGGKSDIQYCKLDTAWPSMDINQQLAKEAYASVLDNVGASLPKRDIVDERIVDNTRNGDATYEGVYDQIKNVPDADAIVGIIDTEADVMGWPVLKSATAPTDTDHDGMPDEWENAHGLNPNNVRDGKIMGEDGYSNLEKYLNSIEFNYPVSNYKLTKISESRYTLDWSDTYLAEDSFRVERSDNNGDFRVIATLPKYSNTYTDNSVPAGKVTYRVIALNNDNATPGGTGISTMETAVSDVISASGKAKVSYYPNPFSDQIHFDIPLSEPQKVRIELYDITGKKVTTLVDQSFPSGKNSFVWNSNTTELNLSPGLYLISIEMGNLHVKQEAKLIKI